MPGLPADVFSYDGIINIYLCGRCFRAQFDLKADRHFIVQSQFLAPFWEEITPYTAPDVSLTAPLQIIAKLFTLPEPHTRMRRYDFLVARPSGRLGQSIDVILAPDDLTVWDVFRLMSGSI